MDEVEQEALDKAKGAGIQVIEIADKTPFQDAVEAGLGQVRSQIRRDDQAHRRGRSEREWVVRL